MPVHVPSTLRAEMTQSTTQAENAQPPDTPTSRGRDTRHCLVVLGMDESEVVCAAGGLIYDWSLGGWDVTVHLAASRDGRSLRILGAKAEPLTSAERLCIDPLQPDAVIVSSLLYQQNHSVREYVAEALLCSYTATAMLGDDWPVGLGQNAGPVAHRLSPAARAFKFHAMLAAEVPPTRLGLMETFRGSVQRFTPRVALPFVRREIPTHRGQRRALERDVTR